MSEAVVLSVMVSGREFPVQNPACTIKMKSGAHTELEIRGVATGLDTGEC